MDLPLLKKRYPKYFGVLILPSSQKLLLALPNAFIYEQIIISQLPSKPFLQQTLAP